jgi:hypothetical protein
MQVKDHRFSIVTGIVALSFVGGAGVVMISLGTDPSRDPMPAITGLLGFLGVMSTAMAAVIKADQVDTKAGAIEERVNGRLTTLEEEKRKVEYQRALFFQELAKSQPGQLEELMRRFAAETVQEGESRLEKGEQ